MVKALRALPGEKREIALRPWLYRIAHNEAIELRRTKRETQALDGHLLDAHSGVAETAEHRERLLWLLRDLSDLPERQRTVLVMRELNGLDFADIGATLGTSGAVVRQTLYEARRNLEQMDFGRSLRCEAVTRVLSEADGRVSSRREIRAHLSDCPDCRLFQERIQARKEALAGIAPLPAGVAAGLLHSALSGTGGSGAGGLAAVLGGGAAKQVGTVGVLKAVATVVVVAVVGTAAVERNLHDHRAARDATAKSLPQRGHAAKAAAVGRSPSPRGARPSAHSVSSVPAPIPTSAPRGTVVGHRPSGQVTHQRVPGTQGPASDGGPSAPTPSAAGKSPSTKETATAPPGHPPQAEKEAKLVKKAEKQEEKAAKQEEKAAKAEAKGKPEHPPHPEHPSHPSQSQKPAKVLVAPEEEGPEGDETAPAPEAEAPSEPTSPGPKGKAKGHEKQLAG